jgi:hypothetical protein
MQKALDTDEISGPENITSTAPGKGKTNTTSTAHDAASHSTNGVQFGDRIDEFQQSGQNVLHKLLEKFHVLRTTGCSNLDGKLVAGVAAGCVVMMLALWFRPARQSLAAGSAINTAVRKATSEKVAAAKQQRLSKEANSNRRRKLQRKLREAMGASVPQDDAAAVAAGDTGPLDAGIMREESLLEEEGEWECIGKPSPPHPPKQSQRGAMVKSTEKTTEKPPPTYISNPAANPTAKPATKSAVHPTSKPATKSAVKPADKTSQHKAAPVNAWTTAKCPAPKRYEKGGAKGTSSYDVKTTSVNKPSKPKVSKPTITKALQSAWTANKNSTAKSNTQKSNMKGMGSSTGATSNENTPPNSAAKPKAEASNELPPNGKPRASRGDKTLLGDKIAHHASGEVAATSAWGNGPAIPSLVFNDLKAKSEHKMLSPAYAAAEASQNLFGDNSAKTSDSRNGCDMSNTPQRCGLGLQPTR